MTKRSLSIIAACLLALAVASCRTATIHNVDDASFVAPRQLTLGDVGDAIRRAGGGLGWRMRIEEPGHMVGTLALRSHVAIVDINYDTSSFSINYKDSTNLNYDGTNIHSNYNGWIQNLEQAILAEITAL
jgi:hypothetical protein